MKQTPVRLGPLALILALISICLTTLAILTFTTARADLALAERYADTVSSRCALEREGQAFLQELSETDRADYGLMDWERDADGVFRKTLIKDGFRLQIGFRPEGAKGYRLVSWRIDRSWTEDDSMGELWDGGF